MNIINKKSPNFWSGRRGYRPEAIVIHIMDGTLSGTDSWFASPSSQVSAHYGIGKRGEIHRYVDEENTAWHAGKVVTPSWKLIKANVNPNLYTIGIEHEGGSYDAWSEEMKTTSAELIRQICNEWSISIDREHIIGHYEINAAKPNCPAVNKKIIDELIERASDHTPDDSIEKGVEKIEEGLAIIKKFI